MASTPPTPPPRDRLRIVKSTVHHPIRTCIAFLSITLILLICAFIITTTVLLSLWLRSYKVLTQETPVAEITVSRLKKDKDGRPYYELTYKPIKTENALQAWIGLGGTVDETEQTIELPGDRFRIEADFFRWGNTFTLIGLKPMFKVVRIASDYTELKDYNILPHKAVDINGGPDRQWKLVKDNAEKLKWLGNAYTVSTGQDTTYHERTFDLVATEDGLVLKAK